MCAELDREEARTATLAWLISPNHETFPLSSPSAAEPMFTFPLPGKNVSMRDPDD